MLSHFDWALQGTAVGDNLVKLKYTTASAVKEKEGKLMCQAEVLGEGEANTTRTDTRSKYFSFIAVCHLRIWFPSGLELPQINYDINGKKHQFVYGNYVGESAEVVGTSVFEISYILGKQAFPESIVL